ncbi:MAG: PAS domain-containing protein, partial [Bdellovibrionia bacterium]
MHKAARSERFQPAHLEEVSGPVIELNEVAEITHWNVEAETFLGWSAAEAVGRKVGEFLLAPFERARFEAWQNLQVGLEEFTALHKSRGSFQALFKHIQDRRFLIRAISENIPFVVRIESFNRISKSMLNSAAPIRNEKREIIGAVVVNQDIRELTRDKAKDPYNEKEFLKAVLDNTEDGIVACDSNGILTLFNRAAREFHGFAESPLPPEEWAKQYDLYRADGKTSLPKEEIPLFRALQGEKIHGFEMVIAPKGAPPRRLLASG